MTDKQLPSNSSTCLSILFISTLVRSRCLGQAPQHGYALATIYLAKPGEGPEMRCREVLLLATAMMAARGSRADWAKGPLERRFRNDIPGHGALLKEARGS